MKANKSNIQNHLDKRFVAKYNAIYSVFVENSMAEEDGRGAFVAAMQFAKIWRLRDEFLSQKYDSKANIILASKFEENVDHEKMKKVNVSLKEAAEKFPWPPNDFS